MALKKNKVVAENPDMIAAQKRLQEKQQKEIEEKVAKITNMNRRDRKAFAKANNLDKIPGTKQDHIKREIVAPKNIIKENGICKGDECINDRRNGSSFCQECSDNFKKK